MTIHDLPSLVVSGGEKRRADAELGFFAAGLPFDEIADILEMMRAVDARIATAVRDAIPEMRAMGFLDAMAHLQRAIDAAAAMTDES